LRPVRIARANEDMCRTPIPQKFLEGERSLCAHARLRSNCEALFVVIPDDMQVLSIAKMKAKSENTPIGKRNIDG